MLQSLLAQAWAIIDVVICGYALYAGSWRERCGAIIFLIAYLASMGFAFISPQYTTLYLLVADTLCLQVFYVVSWKSPHPWPKWAVAAQLVCVVMEVLTLLKVGISNYVFLTVENTMGLAVMLALLLGTISAAQAKRDARRLSVQK
ncbi:MAG: hypothetical protein JF615_13980 [Asticcacaulis sp.]|nr:hypothetical protein [Asticcacaulis sp.]